MSSLSRPYLGTHSPSFIDNKGAELPDHSGIYVGIVKKIDTSTRLGRLWVYIKQFGGPDPNDSKNWKLVSYASPYFGQTQGPRGVAEYTKASNQDNTFDKTSQTYGFYMIPPDIENLVLCCFVMGSVEGYWFACINKSASIYMTPATGAVDYKFIEQSSIPSYLKLNPNKKYPVGEWNENLASGYSNVLTNIPKPLHVAKTEQLMNQGLDEDEIRGTITSSSQRDPISSVFGFSTPGRPISSQDSAFTDDRGSQSITTRLGGHSLTMDDGDSNGSDNLVRLKSSAGHQILMHDTEGILYISNASGNAWVELTKAGDILIYGANDMSVRTSGNLMMHSDKNISFFAAEDINLAAGKSVTTEAKDINQTALVKMNVYGKKIQTRSASTLDIVASSSIAIRSSGRVAINGNGIALNGRGSSPNISNPPQLRKYSLPDVIASPNGPRAVQYTVNPGKLFSTNYKVPTHEPYLRQGFSQAMAEAQAELNTFDTDIDGNPISPTAIVSAQGPVVAQTQSLFDPAPSAAFITQPAMEGSIGELTADDVRAFTAQLGYTESRGTYDKIEQSGFVGKYQFSADDLVNLGYIKDAAGNTLADISNPNTWMNKDNIASLDDFLASPELQERAIFNLTKKNYAALQESGVITKTTSKDVISGMLSVAHLTGPSGATEWFKTGKFSINANGYSPADYFNRGRFSATQSDVYKNV